MAQEEAGRIGQQIEEVRGEEAQLMGQAEDPTQ